MVWLQAHLTCLPRSTGYSTVALVGTYTNAHTHNHSICAALHCNNREKGANQTVVSSIVRRTNIPSSALPPPYFTFDADDLHPDSRLAPFFFYNF